MEDSFETKYIAHHEQINGSIPENHMFAKNVYVI